MIKKNITIVILLVTLSFLAYSEDSAESFDGISANSQITSIRLTGFEDASFWKVAMPLDQGIISKRTRSGAPKDIATEIPPRFDADVYENIVSKELDGEDLNFINSLYEKKLEKYTMTDEEGTITQIENNFYVVKADGVTKEKRSRARTIFEDKNIGDKVPELYSREKVLGVKIEYIARGYNWFSVIPIKPIVVEGRCQSMSVWVAGRNYKHVLKFLIQDFNGSQRILYGSSLNFTGWKKITTYIPGNEKVKQWDHHFIDKEGIKFNGFLIECDPIETFGSYFIYFDELRATTDLFNESTRDDDDMRDDW